MRSREVIAWPSFRPIAALPLVGAGRLTHERRQRAQRFVGAAAPNIAHPSLARALELIGGAHTDDDPVAGMDALLDVEGAYQNRMRELRELGKRGWYN